MGNAAYAIVAGNWAANVLIVSGFPRYHYNEADVSVLQTGFVHQYGALTTWIAGLQHGRTNYNRIMSLLMSARLNPEFMVSKFRKDGKNIFRNFKRFGTLNLHLKQTNKKKIVFKYRKKI